MQALGKVALVTGGAMRVGRAIALALASRGCHVAISYLRSAKAAKKTVADLKALGVKATSIRADVSKIADVTRMEKTVRKQLGPVDILVNNASIFEKTPWPRISEKAWDRHIDINLKGPFLCSRAFGPSMVRRKRGKIINLVDWSSQRPFQGYIPYCVSKAGLVALTQATAKALAPHVQVNGVSPGAVLFPKGTSAAVKRKLLKKVPLAREGSARDVANTVLFLIEGSDYVTGAIYYVDGGRSVT